MSNLDKLIKAGAQSAAGSLLLNGVEVATHVNGAFAITEAGLSAVKDMDDAPAPAAKKPAAKKTPAKKGEAKDDQPVADPEPAEEPDAPDEDDDLDLVRKLRLARDRAVLPLVLRWRPRR